MNILRQSGFTLVSLPREDIRPLSLLLKTGRNTVERLNAPITSLFQPVNLQPPAITENVDLPASFSGTEHLDLTSETNLSFLQGLLKVFSANASAHLDFKKNRSVDLKMKEAKTDFVDIIRLDAFIQDAELNQAAKAIMERLKKDDLYVITEIVKTNSFVVATKAGSDFSAGAELPLKNIADVKSGVDVTRSNEFTLENTSGSFCTIGVKAFQILYDKPSLFSSRPPGFRIKEAGDIKVFRNEEEYPANLLEVEVADIKDAAF